MTDAKFPVWVRVLIILGGAALGWAAVFWIAYAVERVVS